MRVVAPAVVCVCVYVSVCVRTRNVLMEGGKDR